jgi:glycosyltransferase involved in cell wall biosynthesis
MKVGYLHLGPPHHGVARYGRLLAGEARRRPDLVVDEVEVQLGVSAPQDLAAIRAAARRLSAANVVHIQYNCQRLSSVWGAGWTQLRHLWLFCRHCTAPVIVTIHDVSPGIRPGLVWDRAKDRIKYEFGRAARIGRSRQGASARPHPILPMGISFEMRRMFGPPALALRVLRRRTKRILVCTHEERRRLQWYLAGCDASIVPHFVEQRRIVVSSDAARRRLHLEGVRTVTLQGYVSLRKGHLLLIEAAALLPDDVHVIFAGGAIPGNESFVQDVERLVQERGLSDRIRVTGFLSEPEFEAYVQATDLAVCPFESMSASGSLSTWISVGRPILASEMPQIDEYNRLEPNAIRTFAPRTPEALAAAITALLPPRAGGAVDQAVLRLRSQLAMPVVFDLHLAAYRDAISREMAGTSISGTAEAVRKA